MIPLSMIVFYLWRFASRKHEIPCPFWLRGLVEIDNPLTKSNKAKVIIEQSKIQPGMHVIDFGCGPGRLTVPLEECVCPNGTLTAVDMQDEMLRRVEKKAAEKNLKNIEFMQGRIGASELQLSSCHHAVLVNVLGEIPDQQAAVTAMYKVLETEGIPKVAETRFDHHVQKGDTVIALAHKTGFQERGFHGNWAVLSLQLENPGGL